MTERERTQQKTREIACLGGLFFPSGDGDLDFDIDLERDRLGDLLQ